MQPVFIRRGKGLGKQSLKQMSTGIESLDRILRGGFYEGTVCLIEDDSLAKHGLQVARCFLGKGATLQQKLFVYSHSQDEDIVPELRKLSSQESAGLRIAFRYAHYPQAESQDYAFNLSRTMKNVPKLVFKRVEGVSYRELWNTIIEDIQESLESSEDNTPLRILLKGFLGPTWNMDSFEVLQFMKSLKSLVSSLNAVCLVTVAGVSLPAETLELLEVCSDTVLSSEAFIESGGSFGDYSGLLRVVKPYRHHSLQNTDFEALTFGIKRDWRHIFIEPLSLPPEGAEGTKETLEY